MSRPTFSAAYHQAGYRLTNPRIQWSAVKEDGSAVALTVWRDLTEQENGLQVWDVRGVRDLETWRRRPGNTIRRRHIAHALASCGGRFDIILCQAADPLANPRRILSARSEPRLEGRIDSGEFISETGEFRLELHPKA